MLVGRREELRQLGALLAAVKRGRSGALVLRGEPGIGKTALLDGAVRRARGLRVLRACGAQSESELPYAGLLALVRPVAELVPTLPEPQAQALTSALALGPAPPADPLAVCAATLGLLAAAAEREPLLAVVDDAHWLDRETAQAIGFAARRLGDERVAILVALRDGEESAFSPDGLDQLVVRGLAPDEANELLGDRVVTAVARRLAELTTGNPLALLELGDELSERQRAGIDPVAEPLLVGEALERAFGRRLDALSKSARAAVLVAAAAGDRDDATTLARAWSRLGAGPDDLVAAERARILSFEEGRLRFRHPLVRAAAYSYASPPDRRGAHAALASVLDEDAVADEQAWHVALAAAGPDEEAAATIEAAGERARGRSRQAALRALTRAAALTPEGESRARRHLAAARAATEVGAWKEAAVLLEHAEAGSGAVPAAELLYLRGVVAGKRQAGPEAADLLERAAGELAEHDPEHAALAEVQVSQYWVEWGNRERAVAAAKRASELPFRRGGRTELAVLLCRGDATALAGRFDEAVGYWRRAAELVDPDDPAQLQIGGEALYSAGDDDGAAQLLHRAESLARGQAALGTLIDVLVVLALSETRAGDLSAAYAAAAECASLSRAIGQRAEQAKALGILGWIEAILGRERECRLHMQEGEAVLRDIVGHDRSPAPSGLGLLELSLGRSETAAEALAATLRARGGHLHTELVTARPILPSLVEALARAGRREEGEAVLADSVEAARRLGRPHALAPILRCAAVLSADEASFREALELHDRWSNRWERARTELCYGELLRRLKRRAEARTLLRAALEGFEAVGAERWADRARAELAATGERARRRDPSTVDELTPQELQVARLVATGITNRDVAARLFLSPKTIETHLGHVFRKTGVRTRAELAHRFRDSPDSIPASAS